MSSLGAVCGAARTWCLGLRKAPRSGRGVPEPVSLVNAKSTMLKQEKNKQTNIPCLLNHYFLETIFFDSFPASSDHDGLAQLPAPHPELPGIFTPGPPAPPHLVAGPELLHRTSACLRGRSEDPRHAIGHVEVRRTISIWSLSQDDLSRDVGVVG